MSEAFLSRWSRLKKTGEDVAMPPSAVVTPVAAEISPIPAAQNEPVLEDISQNLPPIASLTNDSDFAAFMQPKVPEALKRQALKKLFTNPQFNVMDGLDVYIDDYSVSVPIPDDWYKDIPSWQAMLNPKPPMVVTDGGYAVEADSTEGIATLKAREEAASGVPENVEALVAEPAVPQNLALGAGDAEPLSLRLPELSKEGGRLGAEVSAPDEHAPLDQSQLPEYPSQKNN